MGHQLSDERKRAKATIQGKWKDVARIRTFGWADFETAQRMHPFIRAPASTLRIVHQLPALIFMSREETPGEIEVAVPFVDPAGAFGARLLSVTPLRKEIVGLLNEFAQAIWFALAQQMLPPPQHGKALEETLVSWTGKELLELSSAPKSAPPQGNDMKPPTSVEEWKALPELEIPTIKTPHEKGRIIKILKVGALTVPPELCREAGLNSFEELRNLPPPARVALPTATAETDEGPKLYRLPQSLGDWAFTCVAGASQGMNPFPERVEFSLLDGRYTADIL